MRRTRIFVSSTCFDLAPIRDELRRSIADLGHEPILSDNASFPVLPERGSVENCLSAIRDCADLAILIVGGRRGSLDPNSQKPITNLEYETALTKGIEVLVFVDAKVWGAIPLWKKNPTADFSSHVDCASVFSFVEKISNEKWVFQFSRAQDITTILKEQLSAYLRDLIERKLSGRLSIHPAFAAESPIVQRLVQDRPRGWEYSLSAELLKPQIIELSKSLDEACAGMRFRKTRVMNFEEYSQWTQSQLHNLTRILRIMTSALEDGFLSAWGAPGEPGDAVEIKRVVERFVSAGQGLVEWEAERASVVPPELLEKAHNLSAGWAKEIFLSFRSIPAEMERVMRIPGDHEIAFRVRCPDFGPVREEMDRILHSGDRKRDIRD